MRIFVARERDTIRSLSQLYEVSLYDLLSINPHITNPDMNIRGMTVNIPEPMAHLPVSPNHPPVPVCLPAVLAKLIDHWVPVTPLSEMEQAEYDILIIGTGMGGTAALWRFCEQIGTSPIRIGIIDRGGLLLPTHALNTPTLSDWNTMLEFYLNPAISEPLGDLLPEYPGARLVYALGGRTQFWAGTTPRIPPLSLRTGRLPTKSLSRTTISQSRSCTSTDMARPSINFCSDDFGRAVTPNPDIYRKR